MTQALKEVIEESMKINIIEYEPTSDHKFLTTSLEELVDILGLARIDIAKEQSW